MLYFIPAWYQQNQWCENEQNWHARRMKTEFDDTVKHIQLFHRSQAYPFQIMLLSFAPNFRHFLHRQSVFHAPYWSCFDAIQEIERKKIMMFSVHNLKWPEHIEFTYTPFVMIALLKGEKYAQVEFGEDGNLIMIDMFKDEKITRRNIYDDRGFVSSTIVFENEIPQYQDYLTEKGVWKIRHFFADGHIEVNPKTPTFTLEYAGEKLVHRFKQETYKDMSDVIYEVLSTYVGMMNNDELFCVAMHELHTDVVKRAFENKKVILSFYDKRYDIAKHSEDAVMVENANYVITDSMENLNRVQAFMGKELTNITDITPFDSRVDFGISQQLNVQKIMVPVDGLSDAGFEELIIKLGEYLPTNENARIHLFTRLADYDRKKRLLDRTKECLLKAGMPVEWAAEEKKTFAENALDAAEEIPVRFFVEQCVDELAVSKCIREQRLIVDMRETTELYLRITGISVGIPQIVYSENQFVEEGKNGAILKDMKRLPETMEYYLDSLTNWNEAMIYSYELGKKYTTRVLIDKWKEVIHLVGNN